MGYINKQLDYILEMLSQNICYLQIFIEHLVYVRHFAKYLVGGGKNTLLVYYGFHCTIRGHV